MEKMSLGLYKHYKGEIYEVIGVAKHSETLDELVVYKATYQKEGELVGETQNYVRRNDNG